MSTQTRRRKKSFTANGQVAVFRFPSTFDHFQVATLFGNGTNGVLALEGIEEPGLTPSTAAGFTLAGITQAGLTANIAGLKAGATVYDQKFKALRVKLVSGDSTDCTVYVKTFTRGLCDVDGSADYQELGTADTDDGETLL